MTKRTGFHLTIACGPKSGFLEKLRIFLFIETP